MGAPGVVIVKFSLGIGSFQEVSDWLVATVLSAQQHIFAPLPLQIEGGQNIAAFAAVATSLRLLAALKKKMSLSKCGFLGFGLINQWFGLIGDDCC